MRSLPVTNTIELNERRAESSLMNMLVSLFAFTEPTVRFYDSISIRCNKIPEINPHTAEGLCYHIIDAPVGEDGLLDFSSISDQLTSYRNSHSFYSYTLDTTCEMQSTLDVILATHLCLPAVTFLRLGRYPTTNEMVSLRQSLNIPASLTEVGMLTSYLWIIMHERGWFHQEDLAELEISLSLVSDSNLVTKFFHDVLAVMDSVRQTAKMSKVRPEVISVVESLPQEAKASYAMLLTSIADLSEYIGNFYDSGFNSRYQKSRGLQMTYDLGYYDLNVEEASHE